MLRACYEAGPTGFELARLLHSISVDCQVIAPSLIPKAPGRYWTKVRCSYCLGSAPLCWSTAIAAPWCRAASTARSARSSSCQSSSVAVSVLTRPAAVQQLQDVAQLTHGASVSARLGCCELASDCSPGHVLRAGERKRRAPRRSPRAVVWRPTGVAAAASRSGTDTACSTCSPASTPLRVIETRQACTHRLSDGHGAQATATRSR